MDDRIRMCSLPDSLTTEDIGAKWHKPVLLACVTGVPPGKTLEQWQAWLAEAWAYWANLIPKRIRFTDTARLADVLHGAGLIDGRGKTLAWSELPNGADTRLQQKYDAGELWGDEIDPVAVMCHEIGHALGLGHDNAGGAALMDPYYSPRIRTPQPRDVARIQVLYGKPVQTSAPVPPAGLLSDLAAMEAVESIVKMWRQR